MNRAGIPRQTSDSRISDGLLIARRKLENLLIQLFRKLRRWERFRHSISKGVRGLRHPKAARDSGATPPRYRDLASSLKLADRPMPLTRFERPAAGEALLIGRMARLAANAVVENYCALKSSNAAACAMRDQHAKSHGCVKAEFVVLENLPAGFTTSLFRPGARYDALVRFSNGQGKPQSDRKLDGRGLSIKLSGVEGTTFLRELTPERTPAGEHDFLFSSFPVFFCKNAVDYTEFMDAVTAGHETWREKLAWVWRWVWFVVRHPRQFITFLATGFVRITNPLTATYHSMSPYLFGEDKVVRYLVSPETPQRDAAGWWAHFGLPRSPNFLRDALVNDLRPGGADNDVVLNFAVRVRHSATPQDVENAALWWTRPRDRVTLLGKIRIPRQEFEAPHQRYETERMTFSPWNCLPEHRPLGSINRMRLAVYLASLQVRRKLNMVGS
jgi:Catalase